MELPAPFGKYEILERIATGGMAEVFLARSFGVAGFEKQLVIKRIRPERAHDPRFVAMFVNEAKIGVHLNHPNIVHVYELGRVDGAYYIAMEHLRGNDLTRVARTLRSRDERMPPALAVNILAEACRGLAFAHGIADDRGEPLGLVHRDVSPHNLFVTFDGEVKLVDFGIARLMHADAEATAGGGKFAYMSPEQARGETIDARSDLYSVGIVLWELLVGRRLFQHEDEGEKRRQVEQGEVPDPDTLDVDLDPALAAILRRALAPRPEDRHESAAHFEEDLRAWLYDRRERVGRAGIARMMRDLFPEAPEQHTTRVDLSRLVSDVENLDARESTRLTGTPSASTTPPPLPGLGPPVGERKRVAVVVVDVDGFTPISARAEPEVVFKRHFHVLRWIHRLAGSHGGTVQRLVDDQAYIFFGFPRTRSDDLARALDCAAAIRDGVAEHRASDLPLQVAIGVHAGEITVQASTSKLRYAARGDTTRFARRLCGAADHGQVLVSERVLNLAQSHFNFHQGQAISRRGGAPPVPSYVLAGRRDRHQPVGRGPWVRRGDELEVLRDTLLALQSGQGAILRVVGPAGAGKTRLVSQLAEAAARRSLPVYLGRATEFGDALDPVRQVVREILGEAGMRRPSGEVVLDRVGELGLFPRDAEALAALLAGRKGHARPEDVSRAAGRLLHGMARQAPFLVVIEDLHHLQPSARKALGRVLAGAVQDRALVLATARELEEDVLPGRTIALGALDAVRQRELVAALLGTPRVGPRLAALVERTCEGSPAYIEELLAFLVQEERVRMEAGVATLGSGADPSVPGSLAALIAARIDALDPASKGALQLAAVIGPTFTAGLLGEAMGFEDPIPLVTDLASHGLIRRASGADRWAFTSEFVRESALMGTLGVQRRDYHRLVASALERLHPDERELHADDLARHWGQGGRPLAAARHALIAGEERERHLQLERARDAYRQGLDWVTRAPDTPETWEERTTSEADLTYHLGHVEILLGNTGAGERSLRMALEIAGDSGMIRIEARAHLALGKHFTEQGRALLAQAHLEQAVPLLSIDPDPTIEQEILEAQAVLAHDRGDVTEAEALWERALSLATTPAARASSLTGLATRFLSSGDAARAAPLFERALAAAREAQDRILEGRVLNNLGLLALWNDDAEGAIASFRRALRVREGIGYLRGMVVNHHNIADVHLQRGDRARAYVSFRRSRELAEEMGWHQGVVLNDVYLHYLEACRGDGGAPAALDASIAEARRIGDMSVALAGTWLAGRWLIDQGRLEEGRDRLEEAVTEAEGRGMAALERWARADLDDVRSVIARRAGVEPSEGLDEPS